MSIQAISQDAARRLEQLHQANERQRIARLCELENQLAPITGGLTVSEDGYSSSVER